MKKKVYMMESFVTYVNKGYVEIDLDYFPELEHLDNHQLAEKLKEGEFYVDSYSGEIRPKELHKDTCEELKDEWLNEDGKVEYNPQNLVSLWDWHNDSDVDFDKIKCEEHYFIVE